MYFPRSELRDDVHARRRLGQHLHFIAEYEDGTTEMFAVPQATLDQGPGEKGVVRIIAGEWQRDGFLKPGRIVGVRGPKHFA